MNELAGGVKNAMERNEPIEKIRQSFLNAGYPPQDVQQAINEAVQPQSNFQALPSQNQQSPQKKSHTLTIIIIIASVLILVSAGLLGLYWDKLFA